MNRTSPAKIMAAVRALSATLAAEGVTHRVRIDVAFEQWPEFRTMLAPLVTAHPEKVGDYFSADAMTATFQEWRRPTDREFFRYEPVSGDVIPDKAALREAVLGRILPDLTKKT